jgi:tetratricopeptide (TPR) repeat protein
MQRLNVKLVVWLGILLVVLVGGIWGLHSYQVNRNADSLIVLADKTKEEGDLREAARHLNRYMHYRPDDAEVQGKFALLLSDIAVSPGATSMDVRQAYAALETALRKDPNNIDVLRKLAQYALRIGRIPDAVSHYENLLAKNPDDAFELKLQLIACYQRQEKHDQSRAMLEEIIEKEPTQVKAYVALAQVLMRHFPDERDAAVTLLDQMVAANPQNFEAYLERGKYRRMSNLNAAAQEDIRKAVELNPDDLEVCLTAAEFAAMEDNMAEARNQLNHALKFHADNFRAQRAMATLDFAENKADDAIARLKSLVGKDTSDKADLYLTLIDFQLRNLDSEGARKSLEELRTLKLVPNDLVDYHLARVLMTENKPYEASKILERVRATLSAMDPLYAVKVDLLLGACYADMGLRDLQQAAYERALAVDPLNGEARLGLAMCYVDAGRDEDAEKELMTIAGREPRAAAMLLQIRMRKMQQRPADQQNWAELESMISEVEGGDKSKSGLTQLMKADFLMKQGKHDEAKAVILEAREAYPDNPGPWLYLANWSKQVEGKEASLKVIEEGCQKMGFPVAMRAALVNSLGDLGDEASLARIVEETKSWEALPAEQRALLWQTLGQTYYRLRKLDDSLAAWRRVLADKPNDPQMHAAAFRVAQEMENDEEMLSQLNEMKERLGEDNAQFNYCSAARLITLVRLKKLDKAELAKAREFLAKASDRRPNWYSVASLEGDMEILNGNVEDAIARYQRGVELGETNSAYLRRLIQLLNSRRRFDEAKAVLAKLGEKGSLSDALKREKLIVDLGTGNLQTALQEAEALLKNSEEPADLIWYSKLLAANGRTDEAIASARQAIDKKSDDPYSWIALVELLANDARISEAEDVIREIETKLPQDTVSLVLAQSYDMLNKSAEAEAAYQAAVDAKPDDLSLVRTLAGFYLRKGRLGEADKLLDQMLQQSPAEGTDEAAQVAWARRMKATVMARLDPSQAKMEQAMAILEKNAGAEGLTLDDMLAQARILAQRTDGVSRRKAIEVYEAAMQRGTIPTDDRFVLAQLYDRTGDWTRCRQAMYDLIREQPSNYDYQANFIRMLLRHDEVDDAGARMERFVALNPNALPTTELRARYMGRIGRIADAIELIRAALPRPLPPQQVQLLPAAANILEDMASSAQGEDTGALLEASEQIMREYAIEDPSAGLQALARYLGRHEKPDEALDICEQQLLPSEPDRALQVGLVVARANANKGLEKYLSRIEPWAKQRIDSGAATQDTWLAQAELLQLQQNFDEASNIYRRLLTDEQNKMEPIQEATALNNLAFLLAVKDNNGSEALTLIKRAIDIVGPLSDLLDTRGMAHLAIGENQQAVSDLKQCVEDNDDPVKHFHLALAHHRANDKSAAMQAMQDARIYGLTDELVSPIEQKLYKELVSSLAIN